MKRRVFGLLLVAGVASVAIQCGGSQVAPSNSTPAPSPAPSPTPSPTPTPAPAPTVSFSIEGTVLTDASSGFPGRAIADVAAIQLRDGRWRLLFDAGGAIRSATSVDGLALTMESGTRLPTQTSTGQTIRPSLVKVFRLDNGQVRAYFNGGGGNVSMYSAISNDEGLTFTMESGERTSAALVGGTGLTGGSVIRLSGGRFRMYFSSNDSAGFNRIFSATSSDALNWTLDTGQRIEAGTSGVEHPEGFVNADGSIALFYFRRSSPTSGTFGIYMSTSTDGLTFSSERFIISPGNDPNLVRVGGTVRMYYNWGDGSGGTIYAARASGSGISSVPSVLRSFGFTPASIGRH